DDFSFSKQFEYSWDNQIVNARWQGLADRKASPSVSLSYGQYRSILTDPAPPKARELTMTMRYFKLRTSVNYIQDDHHNALASIETSAYIPHPERQKPFGEGGTVPRKHTNRNHEIEAAVFINDAIKTTESLSISAGLRYS